MKKFLKVSALVIVIVPLAFLGYLSYSNQKNLARPTPEALAALESTPAVTVVESGDWLIMQPNGGDATTGVIVYPGANCDIRGYAPVTRAMAAAGYLVVGVSMPFDFAIFAPNSADEVLDAFPDIKNWVIVGHSMGGAMASHYAFRNQEKLSGLILWDSYPPESSDLSQASLPVTSIHRATLEGEAPEKFQAQEYLFPSDTTWVPVPGGNHMYFGSFDGGGYEEQWQAVISREAQHQIILAGTLAALERMS